MRPFYRKIFFGFCGVGLVAGGAIAYIQVRSEKTDGKEKAAELSGAEFNAMQDSAKVRLALRSSHLPWTFHNRSRKEPNLDPLIPAAATGPSDMKLVFYRLLGCPYCAKVESVLRYHDVPYEEVQIDPINGGGLPDPRYRLAPQLYFVPLQSEEGANPARAKDTAVQKHNDGVYIVDSSSIVTALASPLGYGKDLRDPRVAATRDWITNRFQSASFVVTNSTLRNAYIAYGYITPTDYQNLFYRIIGSIALYGLAKYKIMPKVLAQPHPFDEAYRKLHATDAAGETDKAATQHPEAWLRDELAIFLGRLEPNAVFHGGAVPDIADIEMYGVTRVVSNHPMLGNIVKRGPFGEWEKAMEKAISAKRDGRP